MRLLTDRSSGAFLAKLMALALLVIAGDALFYEFGQGGGAAFGAYGLALLAALVAVRPALRHDRRALFAMACAALAALAMAWDASLLAWLLFWSAAAMAALLPGTARFDDGWRWFQRLLVHSLLALFGPLVDLFKLSRLRRAGRVRSGGLRAMLPIVVLPLTGSAVFLILFASANPVIDDWLTSIDAPGIDGETVLRVMLWVCLGTLCWSLLRPRPYRHLIGTFDGSGDLPLPGVNATSVLVSLVAFNALFAMQNAMDAAWLWGLMPLPDDLTLSEYAHRGSDPLIGTALLAALFVLVALRPGSSTVAMPAVRRLVVLWIAQNLFLVFNAALRTVDYVDAYSLTVMRISALLWMGLVALGLVLIGWRMLAGKSAAWLINANCAAAALLLGAVSFVDLGAVAAQWNVRHAREVDGTGAGIDLCYLNGLDESALLPLIELEQRLPAGELQSRIHIVRAQVHHRLIDTSAQDNWDGLSQYRLLEAERRLGGRIGDLMAYRSFNCDGTPYEPYQPVPVAVEATDEPAHALTGEAVR